MTVYVLVWIGKDGRLDAIVCKSQAEAIRFRETNYMLDIYTGVRIVETKIVET